MSISMRPSFHGGKDNLNQIFSLTIILILIFSIRRQRFPFLSCF